MMRNMYRIYLYVVWIALLVFAAVGMGVLLDGLFSLTPLRGSYRPVLGRDEVIQRAVFAGVSWVIAAVVGGIHYRLIRRDIASDPAAGGGGVRAFLLNLAEAIAAMITVIAASSAFGSMSYADPNNVPNNASTFSVALAALLVAAVIEAERRRAMAATTAARVFQRIHLYGVPLLLLLTSAIGAWEMAARSSVVALLAQAKIYDPRDPRACMPFPVKEPVEVSQQINGPCTLPQVGYLWLAVLVIAVAIAVYALLARGDHGSVIRAVVHLGSFGLGLAFVLIGLERGAELVLRALFNVSTSWRDIAHPWGAPYDFVSPLTFGLILALLYGVWLRAEAAQLPLGRGATTLSVAALNAAVVAVPFWWGVGRVAFTTFEWLAGSRARPFAPEWAGALALIVVGVGYFPLALRLRARTVESGITAPNRAFVLALLAGGIITGAVGLTIALYALGTMLLGAPLPDWPRTARAGSAALAVGILLSAAYGWIALRGRYVEPLLTRLAEAGAPSPAAAPAVVPAEPPAAIPESIERVLDEFATHTITREEAAARLRGLIPIPN